MKRKTEQSDQDWEKELDERKLLTERRMREFDNETAATEAVGERCSDDG